MWCVKAVISNINTTAHKGVLKLGACFVYKVLSSGKILFQTMLKHLILLTNDTVSDTEPFSDTDTLIHKANTNHPPGVILEP